MSQISIVPLTSWDVVCVTVIVPLQTQNHYLGTNKMGSEAANPALIEAANALADSVKNFTGDPADQMKLLKQTDNLRQLIESPYDVVIKQVEMARHIYNLIETQEYANNFKVQSYGSIELARRDWSVCQNPV